MLEKKKNRHWVGKAKLQTTMHFWKNLSQTNGEHPSTAALEAFQAYRNGQAQSQCFLYSQLLVGAM